MLAYPELEQRAFDTKQLLSIAEYVVNTTKSDTKSQQILKLKIIDWSNYVFCYTYRNLYESTHYNRYHQHKNKKIRIPWKIVNREKMMLITCAHKFDTNSLLHSYVLPKDVFNEIIKYLICRYNNKISKQWY